MEIHKPKAAHSVREFLIEIGTIICGILIALSLEQALETLHWAGKVHEAKAALHEQMVLASVFAEEREAREQCADRYLAELAAAIVASPPQWRPKPMDYCGVQHDHVYVVPFRPWPTEVWRSIEAEGTVSHFEGSYRLKAPFLFDFIKSIGDLNNAEVDESAELAPLAYKITLTPQARITFVKAIERLRQQNGELALSSRQLDAQIRRIGETPADAELARIRATIPHLAAPQAAPLTMTPR